MLRVSFQEGDAGGPLVRPVRVDEVPEGASFGVRPVREGEVPEEVSCDVTPGTACALLGGTRHTVLAGVGPDAPAWREAGAAAVHALWRAPAATVDLRGVAPEFGAAFLEGACLRAWPDRLWQVREDDEARRLAALTVWSGDAALAAAWARRAAAVEGTLLARDLVTAPGNFLTPLGFVERLRALASAGLELEVLQGEALAEAGLTGLLAVGGGSANPPALAVLRWPGTQGDAPVAFVGKGITFDTGGISIKPADRMWEMRADMAGAAACTGAMLTLARRRAPCPAVAVLALAENTTSGRAYRPSDVLRHADGTTIEVIDTDAEGRLVLADALGWVVRQRPAAIIDLATLTGSVVVALGHERAGLFGNDRGLARAVAAAGEAVGERVWRLPCGGGYAEALRSDIADLRHCSPERGQPDASHAASFLRHFVGDVPWAHLDIAGMESREAASEAHPAGATGFGVRLLDALVERYVEAAA